MREFIGAVRAAAGEVARIFPACNDEKCGEPILR